LLNKWPNAEGRDETGARELPLGTLSAVQTLRLAFTRHQGNYGHHLNLEKCPKKMSQKKIYFFFASTKVTLKYSELS
jgi:hypothetical protein